MINLEKCFIRFFAVILCSQFAFSVLAVDKNLNWSSDTKNPTLISKQSYYVEHFYAFDNLLMGYKSDSDLLLLSRAGENMSVIKSERMITHQPTSSALKTQDLVIFKSGKLKGTGILLDDFQERKPMQIRMWLPALRKIRRLSEPSLDDIWGGSHLTYGDIYLRRPEHETHELVDLDDSPACLNDIMTINRWSKEKLGFEIGSWCELGAKSLLLLKSTPVKHSPWYDFRLRLIDAQSFAEYQSEYYKHDQLVKRVQKNWHSVNLADIRAQIWNFWSVLIFNQGQVVGESLAWIADKSYQWNQPVNARLWSEKTLRKIRR